MGRRPWTDNWETYFAKCMENATRLIREYSAFPDSSTFCPAGYCNRCLDAFAHMDRHDQECREHYPQWSRHFARLASFAAEMFSLVADSEARIERAFLEHPDDAVFTWLLTGYAKSGTARAHELLVEHLRDEEAWVRRLAGDLLHRHFDGGEGAPADGDEPQR